MSRAGLLSLLFLYKATSVTADFNEDVENCGLVLNDMDYSLVEPFCHDYVGGYYTPTYTYTVTDPPETYYTTQTVDAYCTKETYPTGVVYYPSDKPKYPYPSSEYEPYKSEPYSTGGWKPYEPKPYETSKQYEPKPYETSSKGYEPKPYETSKGYHDLPPYVYKPYPTGKGPSYGGGKSSWGYTSVWTSEEETTVEATPTSEETGVEATTTAESSEAATITPPFDLGNGTLIVSCSVPIF